MDNCICSEWDGQGWSTCGYPMPRHVATPCPEHITDDKMRKQITAIEKFLAIDHDGEDPFTKEIVAMSRATVGDVE